MILPNNVKIKKFPWTVVPLLSKYTAHAIYPDIYVPEHIYKNLESTNPEPKNVSVLIHEQTHIIRQKKMGWFLWGMRYVFDAKFRFEEELAAVRESMRYLKTKNEKFDTSKSAKSLSSYLYLWCISYNEAKRKLDEVWESM